MAIIRIILAEIFILVSCSQSTTRYEIESSFDSSTRESTLYLIQNNAKIDSVVVNDWYGKDSIYKVDRSYWKYFYSQRCGSGCSITNQMLITIEENRIKRLYDSLGYYTYYSPVFDSTNNSISNKLIEYDSVNLIKKDSVWVMNHKKYLDGKLIEEEKKLK